jgi:hypothetical protein
MVRALWLHHVVPIPSKSNQELLKMKTALSLIAAAVAMLAQGAYAQSASSPTRAEV